MITLYGRHGYLRGTRGYHIHLGIGLIVFIVLPVVIIVGSKIKKNIGDDFDVEIKNIGGVLAWIQCQIKKILGEKEFIMQDKAIEFKGGGGPKTLNILENRVKNKPFKCSKINDRDVGDGKQIIYEIDGDVVPPSKRYEYLRKLNSNWIFNRDYRGVKIIVSIGNFFNKFIFKTAMELKRPADASPIKIASIDVIAIIAFVSIAVTYVRKIIIDRKPERSKYFPHWTYKYQERHPKASATLFMTLAIYFLIKGYKYIISNGGSLEDILKYTLLLLVAISSLVGLRYYVYKKLKGKTFTFKYNKYVKTKSKSKKHRTRHLVRVTKKILYTTIINYSLIGIPVALIVGYIVKILFKSSNIKSSSFFSRNNLKYITLLTVIGLVIAYRKRIEQLYLDYVKTDRHKTVLFKGPQYLTDMDKQNLLPYTLGTYRDINQKFSRNLLNNYDVTNQEYSISMWIWLDNFNDTNSVSTPKDDYFDGNTIFNYNNKPIIKVNNSELMIKFSNDDSKNEEKACNDHNNCQLTYIDKVKQQKWNNIIINFKNSTVDIFINGNLVIHKENLLLGNDYKESMYIGEPYMSVQCAMKELVYYPKNLTPNEIKEKQIIL